MRSDIILNISYFFEFLKEWHCLGCEGGQEHVCTDKNFDFDKYYYIIAINCYHTWHLDPSDRLELWEIFIKGYPNNSEENLQAAKDLEQINSHQQFIFPCYLKAGISVQAVCEAIVELQKNNPLSIVKYLKKSR